MLSASAIALRLGISVPAELTPGQTFVDFTEDSRRVGPGALFVAIRGVKSDGHQFVDSAFAQGAAACVVDTADVLKGRPGFIVQDTQLALSLISALAFEDPSEKLQVVAITGTNGKTTTNWFVQHLFNLCGYSTSRLGTLGSEIPGVGAQQGVLTTPGTKEVQEFFSKSVEAGCRAAVLETSSHALAQRRVHSVKIDVGVFTNLTRDHLDYHQTFEDYFAAKCELFHLLERSGGKRVAVVNIDDPYGLRVVSLAKELSLRVMTFGFSEAADYRISKFAQSAAGATFSIRVERKEVPISIPYIGQHNAHNFAGAFLSGLALGMAPQAMQAAAPALPQVPGRLEAIEVGAATAFVDYSHTPDALEHALDSLRPITAGKLWVLFGCGGDRDRGKRPQMAEVAFRLADEVVVTSDNPRTEDPELIMKDILSGGQVPTIREVDRRLAIAATLKAAQAGDIVLLAGKGHEDYQIIGTQKYPFSDVEEVRKFLECSAA